MKSHLIGNILVTEISVSNNVENIQCDALPLNSK